MKRTRRYARSTSCAAFIVPAALALALLVAAPQIAVAQVGSLEGVWGVVTQPINCATNAPVASPERGLLTYIQGGTFTESSGGLAFAPGQRSAGHGYWAPAGGPTFRGRLVALLLFDTAPNTPPGSPGFQAGWLVATHTITMSGPDAFTATATVQFVNLNREVYRTGCATRVGERFK